MLNKKSQITMFIIVGFVLLLSIGLLFYYKNIVNQKIKKLPDEISNERDSINYYIQQCLIEVAKPLISEISIKGGTLKPNSGIYWNDTQLNVLAHYATEGGYGNGLLLKKSIEEELLNAINQNLDSCVNLSIFEESGYSISQKEHSVNVTINDGSVIINLKYPLEFKFSSKTLSFENFIVTLDSSIGELYKAAIDIVNREIQDGYFDKEDFMLQQGNVIKIKKHKPYPNIVYILKKYDAKLLKDLAFQFAIKGKDTVGKETLRYDNHFGCCTNKKDGTCFKNANPSKCLDNIYDEDVNCQCNENFKTEAEGCCISGSGQNNCELTSQKQCTLQNGKFYKRDFRCSQGKCSNWDCKSTYNYVTDDFSGAAKKHGESWCSYESIVGKGLDYVGTRHYLHSCIQGKEYVEECRDFREEFCAEGVIGVYDKLFSKGLCRINRWYDCSSQKDEASCKDNEYRDCYWMGALYSQLKCHPEVPPGFKFWEGNGQSVCNAASLDKDADGIDYPRSWGHSTLLYCQRTGDCGNYRNYADVITTFGYYNRDGIPEQWVYFNDGYTKRGNEFALRLSLYSNSINDSASIPRGSSGGYAQCDLWQPPINGDCSLCNNSKLHPCTEYRCKSLGRNCIFKFSDNSCFSGFEQNIVAPHLVLSSSNNNFKFTSKKSSYYSNANEYLIDNTIPIHQPFNFEFETSKPTRCKISLYPPTLNPDSVSDFVIPLPEILLNDYDHKEKYNVTIRFPSSNFTRVNSYKLFLRCEDEQGIKNEESLMIISTTEQANDSTPPEIIKIIYSNETAKNRNHDFSLVVNEPFNDCRYSFSESEYEDMSSMNCSTEENDIIYNINYDLGSYVCDSEIFVPSNASLIYFSCEDKYGNKNLVYKSFNFT